MHETLFDEWSPGDVFMKTHRTDPADPMALYRFDGWNPAPASSIGGRLADATWLFNGVRSGSWEKDMIHVPEEG
jgi:hypothetical protein